MQPPSVEQKFALFSMLFGKNDEELGNKANSWNGVDIVGIVQYLIFPYICAFRAVACRGTFAWECCKVNFRTDYKASQIYRHVQLFCPLLPTRTTDGSDEKCQVLLTTVNRNTFLLVILQ